MGKRVTLRIDDREVSVPVGTTVIEAAAKAGIEIPHLCYLEGLEPSGACRLCVVELEGKDRLVISCTQRVQDRMVIRTKTERVLEARRFILELIWSTHPGDCTTCDKSGACELQKYTYELGVRKDRFPLQIPMEPKVDLQSPLIERDLRLCILCGRCVRICQEQGQGVLDFMRRGIAMTVTTPLDKPLHESGCDFCGSCIAVCPVGCLVERDRKLRGREWELKSTKTSCGFCSLGCEVILDVAEERIVRTRPGGDGYLCVRGKFGWDFLASEDRLSRPLVRDGEGFRECDWDEALDYIAARLSEIRDSRGADAVGGLIGGHQTNETLYLFGKLFRAALSTNNVDSTVRLAGAQAILGMLNTFGSFKMLASAADLERAKAILALGPGLGEGYPRARVAIKRALGRGAQLVVVDPLESELARLADLHLRPRPGTEANLVDGIIRALVAQRLHDEEFLAACQDHPEALSGVGEYRAGQSGVAEEEVAEAARIFAEGRGAIVLGTEGCRTPLLARALMLLLLTGRVERAILPLTPLANPWGAAAVGALSELLPGPRPLKDGTAREMISQAWRNPIPERDGLSALEILRVDSPILALYILGADPAASFPDVARVKEKLASLEFLVVQDLFLTETARLAHVVLPLTGFPEEDGTICDPRGRLRRLTSALQPRVPPTWSVLSKLSARLGLPMGYRSDRDVRAEFRALLTGWEPPQELRLPKLGVEEEAKPDREFPYQMFFLVPKFGFPEAARTSRSRVSQLAPAQGAHLGLSPADAERLGVATGDRVVVSSRTGEAIVTAWVWEALPSGLVVLPAWTPEGGLLAPADLDPESKVPRGLFTVRIQPADDKEVLR